MRVLFPAFLLILLCGCQTVSQSRESLIQKPFIKYEIQTHRTYQSAYRDIKRMIKDEFSGMEFFNILVDSELYDDTKVAWVSVYSNSPLLGGSTGVYVEIKEAATDSSIVLIYINWSQRGFAPKIKSYCERL